MSKAKVITISNLSAGDNSECVLELLNHLPRHSKTLIVEFPCIGIPKLGWNFYNEKTVELNKEKNIDQLLLDYDRSKPLGLDNYIVEGKSSDHLLISLYSSAENPTFRKMKSNKTLIQMPSYIKEMVEDNYDIVIFVTQGTLIHPTTYFSMRSSDAVVLYSAKETDVGNNYNSFNRIHSHFGVAKERLFLFSKDHNATVLKKEKVYTRYKELVSVLLALDPKEKDIPDEEKQEEDREEQVGVINPADYLNYKVSLDKAQLELSKDNEDTLRTLTDYTRGELQKHHLDETVASLMNPVAREKVRYYIADIIREQTNFKLTSTIEQNIEWVQKEITELSVLQELLDDPSISSIEVNNIDEVIIERNGVFEHAAHVKFKSKTHLYEVINRMLSPVGKQLSGIEPVVDTSYFGTRICAVADNKTMSGLSANSPVLSIRKFPPNVYTDEECINYGNMSQEVIDFIKFITPASANILYAGGTNSGKTSGLIRLPLYVDKLTRIITLEDLEEMMLKTKVQYKDYKNIVSMLTKMIEDPARSYDLRRLLEITMRMAPHILAIGEIRNLAAALEALNAMNTGHTVWATLHANSARSAAIRLLQLAGNSEAVAGQLGDSLDFILHTLRFETGKRVVNDVSELLEYKGLTNPVMNDIFKYDPDTLTHQRVGYIQSTEMLAKIKNRKREFIKNGIWTQQEIDRWCKPFEVKEENQRVGA